MSEVVSKVMSVEDVKNASPVLQYPSVIRVSEDKEGIRFLAFLEECKKQGMLSFKSDMLVSAILQNQIWGYTHGVIALTFCNINELLKLDSFLEFIDEGVVENIFPSKTRASF